MQYYVRTASGVVQTYPNALLARGAIDLERLGHPEGVVEIMCEQELRSRPGRLLAYHAVSGGFVLGEVVRRVTGLDIRTVLGNVAYAVTSKWRKWDRAKVKAHAQRFIDLHPGHKDVPYAHYLIGVSYYDQMSDVGRDQKMTEQALQSFEELMRRFPDSKYARDARLKADLARDSLAGKEMEVGRYYQQRGDYVAAVNRFRSVVERYQSTSQTPEALHRLTECYLALGVREEAQKTAAVLGYNYPGSNWYADSYRLMTGKEPPPANIEKE